MASANTIKVTQIDPNGLSGFIQSALNVSIGGTITHNSSESFNTINVNGTSNLSTTVVGNLTSSSGIYSSSGISTNGIISGNSIAINNFNIPIGTINSINIGNITITGLPLYDSGQATIASLLTSGTIYGIKQKINAPQFEYDVSGNLMPATGVGVSVILLGISLGYIL